MGDKRGFEIRGVAACEKCKAPEDLPEKCDHGFDPVITETKDGCSCVTGYKCCPDKCATPKDTCEKGKFFPQEINDCCNCQKIECRPCPIVITTPGEDNSTHTHFQCPNECDTPTPTTDKRGCPTFECKRRVKTYPDVTCKSKCQVKKTRTDECGFHENYCECQKPPQCTPKKPEPKDECHRVEQVNFPGVFGCKENTTTCVQCHYWKQVPAKIVNEDKECSKCQLPKMEEKKCGGYKTKCECRQIANCHPTAPQEPPCHKAVKIFSETTFQCEGEQNKCVPCYHWNMVLDEKVNETKNCDSDCMYKRPLALECGAGEECVCNGRSKEGCQPDKPPKMRCFSAKKVLIQNQFMCTADKTKCTQCWKWVQEKDVCPVVVNKKCSTCERESIKYDYCGCEKRSCVGIVYNNCKPARPAANKCYNDPVEVPSSHESASATGCIKCHNWNHTRRIVPNSDSCTLRHLPDKCFSSYTKKGECGSTVTTCQENAVPCSDVYSGESKKCPLGHKHVTLKSECGQPRSACVDCSTIVTSEDKEEYADECYTTNKITIHGQCEYSVKKKNPCPEGTLKAEECPEKGMKRKLFHDKCGCPKLICTGCALSRGPIDVQILLDSSGSVDASTWDKLMNEMKEHFIDSLMTHPDSRMAIARFGTESEALTYDNKHKIC